MRRNHTREPGVLSIKPFRRLWIALSLSSLGDWLSIVALTALAPQLAHGGTVAKSSAVGGVWLATLLPALLFGPLAGALADRLDRRMTMITGAVVAILAGVLPLTDLLLLVNIGTLVAFGIVCIGVFVLRFLAPDAPRPFRAPPPGPYSPPRPSASPSSACGCSPARNTAMTYSGK